MYYYKARIYSPALGRFMQTDPIGYADGMNWYNYAGSDPVNFVDPTGRHAVIGRFKAGGTAVYSYHIRTPATFLSCSYGGGSSIPSGRDAVGRGNSSGANGGGGNSASRAAPQKMWGHYYKPYNQISDGKCNLSDSERRYLAQHFSTPFNAGAAAVNGRVTLYGGNPIAQRITNNGFTVVNQTLPGHQLHSDYGGGSVTRTVLIGENGALYTSTIGQGTNYSRFMAGLGSGLNRTRRR